MQGAVPQTFETREVQLRGGETFHADGNLWLSPEFRILADSPHGSSQSFVYDGQGYDILLPICLPAYEPFGVV